MTKPQEGEAMPVLTNETPRQEAREEQQFWPVAEGFKYYDVHVANSDEEKDFIDLQCERVPEDQGKAQKSENTKKWQEGPKKPRNGKNIRASQEMAEMPKEKRPKGLGMPRNGRNTQKVKGMIVIPRKISPLIEPTKVIMNMRIPDYEWHEFFPNVKHNIGVIISIWAPIVLVYFMDAQIWYAIFSTLFGGILGAFSHLGEIRTLGMLRSRFGAVPLAFNDFLVPSLKDGHQRRHSDESSERMKIAKFSQVWNKFIISLRMEDLISHRERDLLLVPYSSHDISVVQWPPFLLASKIPVALDMAKDIKRKDDTYLFKKIDNDDYMLSAIIECYETVKAILFGLLVNSEDKNILSNICSEVDKSIEQKRFLSTLRLSELPQLSNKVEKLLSILKGNHEDIDSRKAQIINVLQDIMEIIIQDVVRLHLLITVKESAINVPMNLDARRRITFFANSLFMKMPPAPEVRNMLPFRFPSK
ncbi:hypothetical protein Taro_009524, partial [Colocasia esculenta]|nr:hypothetical protein [Colocasia esculenta]